MNNCQHQSADWFTPYSFASTFSDSADGDRAGSECSGAGEGPRAHAWVVQHHSIAHPPSYIHHPLSILTAYCKAQQQLPAKQLPSPQRVKFQQDPGSDSSACDRSLNVTDEEKLGLEGGIGRGEEGNEGEEEEDGVGLKDKLRGYVSCDLPLSLPATCRRQHLHRWSVGSGGDGMMAAEGGGNIKALCCKGVLYR